jgi:predicted Zn-dependent protease
MENRLYPMRELLGDLLLEAGRAKEAAAEYARALELTPNRYRGLLGAARAAEATGDATAARAFYTRVVELSQHADGVRPELARARAFLERR